MSFTELEKLSEEVNKAARIIATIINGISVTCCMYSVMAVTQVLLAGVMNCVILLMMI